MASATGQAVFAVVARDAASAVLGNVGKSMGRLRGIAGDVFKFIASAAATAATALAGIAIASIKGAIDDEKAQTRLVATLRARGLATQENIAAVDALIASAQNLGMTDDQVRASIETATQYTKKFSDALKINKVAQDLAVAKGIDLETATSMVGKAYQGNGKALKQLGVDLTKTIYTTKSKTVVDKAATAAARAKIDALNKEQNLHGKNKIKYEEAIKVEQKSTSSKKEAVKGLEALARITASYGGIAEEVANTNAVKLEAAQIRLNEAFESFGAQFLPDVANAITWFTTDILPKLEKALQDVVPFIKDVAHFLTTDFADALTQSYTKDIEPFVQKIGLIVGGFSNLISKLQSPELKGAFDLLGLVLKPITSQLDHFKAVMDAVIEGMRLLGLLPKAGIGGTSTTGLPMIPGAPGRTQVNPLGGPSYGEKVSVSNTIVFGQDAVSFIDTSLGRTISRGSNRTAP